jgi:hypothetical protein
VIQSTDQPKPAPTLPTYSLRQGLALFLKPQPRIDTGAADDDPSGISTYSVAGAALGYSVLWTAILSDGSEYVQYCGRWHGRRHAAAGTLPTAPKADSAFGLRRRVPDR